MGSIAMRFLMFLCAYSPLSLVFFLVHLRDQRTIALLSLLVGILGIAGLRQYLATAQTLVPITVKIESIQRREVDVVRNLLAYLLPFVAIAFNDWLRAASLGVFFLVVGFLYIRSNLIHINPILSLSGLRIYEIKIEGGGAHSLLSQRQIGRGDSLVVVKLGNDLLLEKKNERPAVTQA